MGEEARKEAARKEEEAARIAEEEAIMLLLSDPPAPPAEETDGTISEDSTEYPPAWNAEWDSLLEELEEMGFSDPVANRAVLSNANGDVKDAVKELVSRERTNRKQQI